MGDAQASATPSDARATAPATLLRRLGLHARKGLSQSFLTDANVCRDMAEAAELRPTDDVLEIGPGLGILTRVLVERAERVVAVELDTDLAEQLPRLVESPRLELIHGDALQLEPEDHFPDNYKFVANLPYQITSPVLTRFLVDVKRPEVMVVMVQLEVAERLAAKPGQSNYLSILAQTIGDVRIIRRVPPGAFYPRPKVTSAVVRIKPHPQPEVPSEELRDFLTLVRAGFTQPRKTVANSLAQGLSLSRAAVEVDLVRADIDPTRRPQQLTIDDWRRLLHSRLAHS